VIKGLKVFDISPGANPVHANFSIENLKDPLWISAMRKPSAYLVRQSDLPVIRRNCSTIIDRKVKDSRKGLSKYLIGLKKRGIPLIDGNYEDSRQIFRSIRDLLSRARESGEKNLYIVGIRDTFFEEIQVMAGREMSRREKPVLPDFPEEPPLPQGQAHIGLIHYIKHYHVPASLDEHYLGTSLEIMLVKQMILSAAMVDNPVMILGETGTGKDIVAQEIHRLSGKKGIAPVWVNCGAVPGALLLSEIFGYTRGAFTGAAKKKTGKWEDAVDGTLFLDEIADLQADHQAMILHALQDGMITPIGASRSVSVNARMVSATGRDLFSMVRQGQFREDLFHRLSGLIIRTPSLRDIPEDIPLIARKIWKEVARDEKASLPDAILEELTGYTWPGNVRELKMVMGQLQALFGREDLNAGHLRMVFSLQGRSVGDAEGNEREMGMQKLSKTLARLKSVSETLHAIEAVFTALREGDGNDEPSVKDSLRFHLGDLEFLCREPSLFGQKETFLAVHHLHGQLSYFFDALQKGGVDSLSGPKGHIREEIERVISRVAHTREDLLKGSFFLPFDQMRGSTT
jgi:transcriptional regulator with AAA-type ATPase domain